jgi:hypothetical protein
MCWCIGYCSLSIIYLSKRDRWAEAGKGAKPAEHRRYGDMSPVATMEHLIPSSPSGYKSILSHPSFYLLALLIVAETGNTQWYVKSLDAETPSSDTIHPACAYTHFQAELRYTLNTQLEQRELPHRSRPSRPSHPSPCSSSS